MRYDLPIYRPISVQDAEFAKYTQEVLNRSLEIIRTSIKIDTFLGRKTHEPFPKEGE